MRKKTVVLYVLLVLLFPQLLLSITMSADQRKDALEDFEREEITELTLENAPRIINIYDQGTLMKIPLEEYVTGVVLAEMPAEFELEALKAQAVASRTFTLKSMQRSKHENAVVCTDAACCQAFISPSEYTGSANDLEKVYSATIETADEVIMFEGNLIEATYFSSSGGQTEDAAAVWGADVPYLQSVLSPGEEIANSYETTESFSYTDFKQLLGLPQNMNLNNETLSMEYTEGGGVENLSIGKYNLSGVQVRALLNLRSTIFTIEFTNGNVLITTKGYGHRVGMSQYGAEVMAIEGSLYSEILKHYYSGIDLVKLSKAEMDAIFDKAENI